MRQYERNTADDEVLEQVFTHSAVVLLFYGLEGNPVSVQS